VFLLVFVNAFGEQACFTVKARTGELQAVYQTEKTSSN